jgi:formylglycine-generating enzyme required for sulfatase activity
MKQLDLVTGWRLGRWTATVSVVSIVIAAIVILRPQLTSLSPSTIHQSVACSLPPDEQSQQPGMVWVPDGKFTIGDTVYQEEGPPQPRSVNGFWMDRTEVTNKDFSKFIAATGYVTTAERPVDTTAHPDLPRELQLPGSVVFTSPAELARGGDVRQWWKYQAGANWRHPDVPATSIVNRDALPVVAITIEDAQAYAKWKGHQLPTEAEWEWAARGGQAATLGNVEQPAQANTWQGRFPVNNQLTDGHLGLAPVGCFAPNGYGLYDMIGNAWEITRDRFVPFHDARDNTPPDQPPVVERPGSLAGRYVIKGGSYLCAPNYCMRYRAGARQGQESDLATSHVGFRTMVRATTR